MRRAAVLAGALVVLGAAVWVLRAFTMATYRPTPPDSRTAVTFRVVRNGSPSPPATSAQALLLPCVADSDSSLVGPLRRLPEGTFAATLQPALDSTETTKFRGCLHDLRVPHARAAAVSIRRLR